MVKYFKKNLVVCNTIKHVAMHENITISGDPGAGYLQQAVVKCTFILLVDLRKTLKTISKILLEL